MPRASLTARTAVNGAVCGLGGWPPVSATTAPITTTRQASQPRMKASPFRLPFSAPRSRMNTVTGNGSRVMPSPMSRRSSTTLSPPHPRDRP